jgi:hypothetical protein
MKMTLSIMLNKDTRHFGKKCSAECSISLCRVSLCKVSLYRMAWRNFIGRFIECLPYLFVTSLVSMLQNFFPLSQRPLGQISLNVRTHGKPFKPIPIFALAKYRFQNTSFYS